MSPGSSFSSSSSLPQTLWQVQAEGGTCQPDPVCACTPSARVHTCLYKVLHWSTWALPHTGAAAPTHKATYSCTHRHTHTATHTQVHRAVHTHLHTQCCTHSCTHRATNTGLAYAHTHTLPQTQLPTQRCTCSTHGPHINTHTARHTRTHAHTAAPKACVHTNNANALQHNTGTPGTR